MNDEVVDPKKTENQTFEEYFEKWSQAHGNSILRSLGLYYYWLKLAHWLAIKLNRIGITANQASYLGVLSAILTVPVYIFWNPLTQVFGTAILPGIIAITFVIICGLMDNIDGALARMEIKEDRMGTTHDLIADRLGDVFLLIGPLIAGLASLYLGLFALFSVILFEIYRSFHMSIGIKMIKSLVERHWRFSLQMIYILYFSIAMSFWNWMGVKIEPVTQSQGQILNFNLMYILITGFSVVSLIYIVYKVRQYDRGITILNINPYEDTSMQFMTLYKEICTIFGFSNRSNKHISIIEKVARIMLRIRVGSGLVGLLSFAAFLVSVCVLLIIKNIYLSILLTYSFLFLWIVLMDIALAISIIQIKLTLKFVNSIKILGYISDLSYLIVASILINPENIFAYLMVLSAGIALCIYEWIISISYRLSKPISVLFGARIVRCIVSFGIVMILLPFNNSISIDIIIGVACASIAIICCLGAVIGYRRLCSEHPET